MKKNIQELDLNHEDFNLNKFIDQITSIEEAEELTESFKDVYKKDRKNLNNFIVYLNQIHLINQFIKNYNSNIDIKRMFFFEKVDHSKLIKLNKLIEKFKELKSALFGGFFKGSKFDELSIEVEKLMGIKKNLNLKHDIEKVIDANYIYKDLEELCKKKAQV